MDQTLEGIKAMSKRLDVPVSWLYGKTRTGKIPHYKVGKYVKFDPTEVMDWIRKQNKAEMGRR